MSFRPIVVLKDIAAAAAILIVAMSCAIIFTPPLQMVTLAKKAPARPIVMVQVLVAVPPAVALAPRAIAMKVSKPALPDGAVAATPLPPQSIAPDPAMLAEQASRVAARLSDKVPASLAPYFDTFIYVSKAASGPWAQHLFLFHKADDGTLVFEQSFPVSTGREQSEQYFTATPTGLFELDVHRFFPMARSAKWNDAQMPWAMFLNYAYRTQMSGVALHAAIGRHELSDIGHRASGGCVRLPLAKANLLYHRFLANEQGQVPVLAFDAVRGTTNTEGIAVRDDKGDIVLSDGLRVLVVIDNFPGAPGMPPQS